MRSLCAFLLLCGTAAGQVIPRTAPAPSPPTSPAPVTPFFPAIPTIPALPLGASPLPVFVPSPASPAPALPQTPVAPVSPTVSPVVAPASSVLSAPAPVPVLSQPLPAASDTSPWPLPPFVTRCAAPQQQRETLHRAAAAIAGGTGHAAALGAQGYVAVRYRYWEVSTSGVSGALLQACNQGLYEFGIAPAQSGWIVLAARPEAQPQPQPQTRPPAAPPPAPAQPTLAQSAPVQTVAAPAPATPAAAIPVGGRLGDLLTLVNQTRQRGYNCGGIARPPAPPLTYDPRLALSAQLHVNAMTLQGFGDHVNPVTKSTPQTRAAAEGWTGEVGENLHTGGQTARETLDWWLGSSVHCANLMNAYWTHFGAGIASSEQATDGPFWVMDFGRAAKR